MRVVVTTCDAYQWLLPEFAARLNMFWPKNEVDVLGYERPLFKLPANFKFISCGEQPEGKVWTTGLIPYFEQMHDEDTFVLMMDDYYLTKQIDQGLMDHVLKNVEYFDKLDLTRDRSHFGYHVWNGDEEIVESAQTARYRSSLQAAIWRVGYFKKFMKPGRTAWQFELEGEREAMDDGAVILGTRSGIVQYDNMILKGERNPIPC